MLGILQNEAYGRVFLIELGEELAGYCVLTLGYSLEFRGVDAIVDELYLRAAYRGRGLDLKKHPSVSETIDWARALVELNAKHLDRATIDTTLSVLLKYETDINKARRAIGREDGRAGHRAN